MITLKKISREVLENCRRIRPVEFRDVTEKDVEMIMTILWDNITMILKRGSLLALKDYMLFRPNLKKKIAKLKAKREKSMFNRLNDVLEKHKSAE